MRNKITQPDIDSSGIYEGGSISQITAEELESNIVAIRQLINSHNLVAIESKNKDVDIQRIKAQNEYLKTSPFVSIIAALISIGGSILIAIGVNLTTGAENPPFQDKVVLWIGGLLLVVGSLANILYPKARDWFNPKKEN